MNKMHEDTSISEHAPKSGVASVTQIMNEMNITVKKVYQSEGIPPFSKKDIQAKY